MNTLAPGVLAFLMSAANAPQGEHLQFEALELVARCDITNEQFTRYVRHANGMRVHWRGIVKAVLAGGLVVVDMDHEGQAADVLLRTDETPSVGDWIGFSGVISEASRTPSGGAIVEMIVSY